MTGSAIGAFIDRLATVETGTDCNNFFDPAVPENALRRWNLELYLEEMLDRSPKVLLLGEAPGFRGMRITGVPFTNRTMFQGPANSFGLFGPGKGYSLPPEAAEVAAEPTATVMWEVLAELQFLPLLWSACPWHTHLPGKPQSSRTPTVADARLGISFWQSLAELFSIKTVVAVGNVAHRSLLSSGMEVPKVRHPSHGGRTGFKQGLEELLSTGVIRR
ncbi:uracil DNA glycosylase superfamily protein [Arthrobacter sp. SLBN-100]|uniref:uracil-DNA glycosylase n=1 Tax=Arthrobacter sp. SLBN-100 TaxID=2768450 RepID=UPI001154A156|nr:uracil-DNA glycosylase [Arthrobacter sp. SLBN-100]TQJ67990.1 uracil DNA glycosylase superfamily protein [Arthrobacter sp. SLBN-100]